MFQTLRGVIYTACVPPCSVGSYVALILSVRFGVKQRITVIRACANGHGAALGFDLGKSYLPGKVLPRMKNLEQEHSMFNALSTQTLLLWSLRPKLQNFTGQPLLLLRKCKQSLLSRTLLSLLARLLTDYLPLRNHPKWGFTIYRCDYRDDATWAHFIDRWSQLVNTWLIQKHQRELIKNLEWTVREDYAALDRATVEDVRKLFTAWTKTREAVAKQQAAIDLQIRTSPRYSFCVHVDAKALDACLTFDNLPKDRQLAFWHNIRDPALGHAPYVNIVEKAMEPFGTSQCDEEEEEEEEEGDDEGGEVISVKVHWRSAVPDIYFALNHAPNSFQALARDVDQDGVHL